LHSGEKQAHGVRLCQHDFGLRKPDAQKAERCQEQIRKKSLGIFELVAHITAFPQ